jgi:hypothetical protein
VKPTDPGFDPNDPQILAYIHGELTNGELARWKELEMSSPEFREHVNELRDRDRDLKALGRKIRNEPTAIGSLEPHRRRLLLEAAGQARPQAGSRRWLWTSGAASAAVAAGLIMALWTRKPERDALLISQAPSPRSEPEGLSMNEGSSQERAAGGAAAELGQSESNTFGATLAAPIESSAKSGQRQEQAAPMGRAAPQSSPAQAKFSNALRLMGFEPDASLAPTEAEAGQPPGRYRLALLPCPWSPESSLLVVDDLQVAVSMDSTPELQLLSSNGSDLPIEMKPISQRRLGLERGWRHYIMINANTGRLADAELRIGTGDSSAKLALVDATSSGQATSLTRQEIALVWWAFSEEARLGRKGLEDELRSAFTPKELETIGRLEE